MQHRTLDGRTISVIGPRPPARRQRDPSVPAPASEPAVPVGAIRELLDEGVVVMAGISNAGVSQIDLAHELLGGRLVSVQDQFSPAFRSSRGELEQCAKLGLSFLPWSPLGGIANVKDPAAARSASIRDSAAGSDLKPTADQFALSSV
jgi:aryl-alcohol dehydrogenase-like predicted oxidoreductase